MFMYTHEYAENYELMLINFVFYGLKLINFVFYGLMLINFVFGPLPTHKNEIQTCNGPFGFCCVRRRKRS